MGSLSRPLEASGEFRLVVECCRRSFVGDEGRQPLETDRIDWDRFFRLIRFHRVEGLAWNALSHQASSIPTEVRRGLAERASQIATQNLRMLADHRRVQEVFQREGLPYLFLKGIALATLAYGNPAVKSAIDIDLLIDPADLERAAGLLRKLSYCPAIPRVPSHDALRRRHALFKESLWVKASDPNAQIDLHTAIADNRFLLTGLDVRAPHQRVKVGEGFELPTFARDEQFAYLSVHGASSAWFRMKWISDFAALLHSKGAAELARLYARSQELGAGRAADQALLLADTLFDTLKHAPELHDRLHSDRATRILHHAALALVAGEPLEPTGRFGGTLPIHWTQMLLKPGISYKLAELSGQVRRALNGG